MPITPIAAENKYDGIRLVLSRDGKRVWIFTEDKKRDRAPFLPDVVADMRRLPVRSVILDSETVIWEGGAPIPRHEMIRIVVSKKPLVGEEIHVNVFDCLYYNGKSLIDLPWKERQVYLKKVLPRDLKHLKRVIPCIITDRKSFDRCIEKTSKAIGSEGAMLKSVEGKYNLKGRTGEWSKLKLAYELKVAAIGLLRKPFPLRPAPKSDLTGDEAIRTFKRLQEKSKTYILRCAFKDKTGRLQPVMSDHKLTPGDLQLKWDAAKKKWKGTEDPRIWQMGKGFPQRKHGEYAYGNTYAKKLDPGPQMGSIVTVRPIMMRKFKAEGKTMYSLAPERRVPIKTKGNRISFPTLEEFFKKHELTQRGYSRIQKLPDGFEFVEPKRGTYFTLSHDGKWHQVLKIIRHWYSGPLLRLEQKWGTTRVTPMHSICDASGNFVDAQTNPELFRVSIANQDGHGRDIKIALPGYEKKGNYLSLKTKTLWTRSNARGGKAVANSSSKIRLRWYFAGSSLKSLMHVLGAYIGEGSVDHNQTSWRVRFSNNDKKWLAKIGSYLQDLSPDFKLNWEWPTQEKRNSFGKYKYKDQTINLTIWSRGLADLLIKYCGKGCKNKHLPSFFFDLHPDFQNCLLEELQFGDGEKKQEYFNVFSSSPQLIGGLSLAFSLRGDKFIVCPNGNNGNYQFAKRKYYKTEVKRRIEIEDFSGYIYDLEVEGSHSFVDAMGCIAVSNSWMFPNLREIDPERSAPDSISDVERIVRASAARTPGKKAKMEIMKAIHWEI